MKTIKGIFTLVLLSGVSLLNQLHAQPKLQKNQPLAWVKSKNDFGQKGLQSREIDQKINNIIQAAISSRVLTQDIEIPFSSEKLTYLGYMHPNETKLFDANKISSTNTVELNKSLHIYKYEDFYISTETAQKADQLNVFNALRAINILRFRYPEAYNELFEKTTVFQTDRPKYQLWQNSNKAFWIAFNTYPDYIASNQTSFLREGSFHAPDNDIECYRNISIMNVDSETIKGNLLTVGSAAIYKANSPKKNYHSYMREGLLETIVHEMLHNYFDYAYPINERFSKLRSSRGKENFKRAEENSIINTSLSYFNKKGGFSESLNNYYFKIFDENINVLMNNNLLQTYGTLFSDLPVTNSNTKDIYILSLLDL